MDRNKGITLGRSTGGKEKSNSLHLSTAPSFFLHLRISLGVGLLAGLNSTTPALANAQASNPNDVGSVQSIDTQSLPQNSDPVPQAPESLQIQTKTNESVSIAPSSSPSYSVDRPWVLETPAGPTAYTLDKYDFEFFIDSPRILQMIDASNSLLGVRFGLTNDLTLTSSYGTSGAIHVGFRWNISNSGDWTTSIQPTVGFPVGGGRVSYNTYFGPTSHPVTVQLLLSKLIDDGHKFNFSLEGGTYGTTFNEIDTYSIHSQTTRYGLRFTSGYDLRLSRTQGLVFWLSPEFTSGVTSESESSSGTSYQSSRSMTELGIKLGVGYQYSEKHLGISVGFAAGPSSIAYRWTEQGTTDFSDSYFSFQGAFTAAVTCKL